MASQIRMTQLHAAGLINARSSNDPKAARKAMWARIRSDLSLPADVRLKAEIDEVYSSDYLKLKDAVSGAYLWRVGDQVVVSEREPVSVDASQLEEATIQARITPTAASRFATTQEREPAIMAITVDDLLAVLRGDDDYQDASDHVGTARQLPQGFPTLTDTGVVLDTTDRILYFRG